MNGRLITRQNSRASKERVPVCLGHVGATDMTLALSCLPLSISEALKEMYTEGHSSTEQGKHLPVSEAPTPS